MKKLIIAVSCMAFALAAHANDPQNGQQACQPPNPTDTSEGSGRTAQSCDPNEISGPLGTGEKRYVQQGDWMDYTIYFENKTNATAAAQEVFVDLPMDENLDWSTLELGEIAFGEHIDTTLVEKKLAGKSKLTASYAMPGTNTSVKTEVKMKDGVLSWYMRDWDPTTADNFPASATGGFLPPNDPETHCGEGHLSFRVKVKDDAPNGAVIRASAQIVFDQNPMIETDPSWWNTVGTFHEITLEIDGVTTNITLVAGEPFGVLPTPSNAPTGYLFDAWYTGPNCTGIKATSDAIVPAGDFSLYPNWSANTYFIAYNANGGDGEMPLQTNTYGLVSYLTSNAFIRASHRFIGWATNETDEAVFEDGAVVSNLTATADGVVNLYATWELITMTASFDLNYSETAIAPPSPIVVTNGAEYGQLPVAEREGYAFDGWANGKSSRSPRVTAETIVTNETDHTLYAQWTPNSYSVRFNAGGGSGAMPDQTLAYDQVARLARNTFFYSRHTFCGWATNETGEVVYENEAEVLNLTSELNAVVDLYGVWDEGVFAAEFIERAVACEERNSILVRVSGGNEEKASSVDVYLTYNTAAAADLDLAKGAVADARDVRPYQTNLKFPLTLSWAAGEVGEKVIAIPVKTDKAVEGDEFFTLQLANAKGIELGEERVCTVTIKDANTYATLQDGVMNPGVKVATSGDGNWFVDRGSPADIDGVAQFYHAQSPLLAEGKRSTLSFGPVKGFGVVHFWVRFVGDDNEENPSSLAVYCDKYNIGTLYNSAYMKEWRSYYQEISSSSLSASHNYSFEFTQGSNPDVHAEIAEVYWDYMGTIFPSTFYMIRTYPSNPAGGIATGSGFYTYGQTFKLAAKPFPGWTFDGWYELVDNENSDGSSYFFWNKSVTVSYRINRDIVIEARFSKIPYVRGLADPADGGKVTGSGLCDKGKKVTLKATANKNFTFMGWRRAEDAAVGSPMSDVENNNTEFVATTPTLVIDRSAKPAASSKTSTTLTNIAEDATFYAVFKSYPEVFVTVDATDGKGTEPTGKGAGKYVAGTITGMGKYAVGKTKIALKATANKGYVFAGWLDAYGALLTKDATYTIAAMGEDDVEYVAKFVTIAEDKAKISLSVGGAALSGAAAASWTNYCGVAVSWPVVSAGLSATTVKVSGLPSGLKLVQDKKTKVYSIEGVPTAASKTDKKGNVTPSAVKFTVTTAGKSSQTFEVGMLVLPLPSWVVGTFDGALFDGEEPCGLVSSFTVAANGKISGKLLNGGKSWALSAPSFSSVERPSQDVEDFEFLATVVVKSGKESVTNEVSVMADSGFGFTCGVARSDGWAAWQNLWKMEPWKTVAKPFAKAKALTLDLNETDTVTLKFASSGVVTATGKFVRGKDAKGKDVVYSATCSSVLIHDGGAGYDVYLHFPAKQDSKGKVMFGGLTVRVSLGWDAESGEFAL